MIEGAELSPEFDVVECGFNIVELDLVARKYKLFNYKKVLGALAFECDGYDTVKALPYGTKSANGNGVLTPSSEFLFRLNDPGATYRHHKGDKLMLEDIFIYPDVLSREKTSVKKTKKQLISNSKNVIEKGSHAIFFGGEKSGKSSLCCAIFLEHVRMGKLPLILSPDDFSRYSVDDFEIAIYRVIERQYGRDSVEKFRLADEADKVIIVDDFHVFSYSHVDKRRLLNELAASFSNVFVFSDDSRQYEEAFGGGEVAGDSSFFSQFSMLPFGHKLRGEMIDRWFFGLDVVSPVDYLRKKDAVAHMLNVLVQSNYVPAFPFYMYTAMSAFDGKSNTLAKSSYGHYYDVLLTSALARVNIKNEEIDLRKNYLTELAYYFFSNSTSVLGENQVNEFHAFYCKEYSLSLSSSRLLKDFCGASILAQSEEYIYFKYKYFYHYFLARYVANNIHREDVRKHVDKFCEKLNSEFSSSMLMFITHQSKDPSIIEKIVEKAKLLFEGHSPLKLEDDAQIVNDLLGTIPKLAIPDISLDDARRVELEARDRSDLAKGTDYYGDKIELDVSSCASDTDSLMVCIDATYKVLEISGQLLKNYYGSLRGAQKYAICEQGFHLPLRALNDFFRYVAEDREALMQEMRRVIDDRRNKIRTDADKEALAKTFVFNYASFICSISLRERRCHLEVKILKSHMQRLSLIIVMHLQSSLISLLG